MRIWASAGLIATAMATALSAGAIDRSIRPEIRPLTMGKDISGVAATPVRAVRPPNRPNVAQTDPNPIEVAANQRFENWTVAFKRRASAQGISTQVLERSFQGVAYDTEIIERDSNQSEFTKTIWEYLESAASETRIENGKSALLEHQSKLDAIEAKYGVEKEVVVAVWGLESAYGKHRGDADIIQSLATLAFDGRRGKFFEEQLIAALKILQSGDTSPRRMTGSWAGAMGHTQFIPTSYLAYAVDFTGDGKRDIWSDDPTDALASTAAYLARFGWIKGQPWGIEVTLPADFDFGLARRDITKSSADWTNLGVVDVMGKPVSDHGLGSILLPAGRNGAAFMVFKNFSVIERYNAADAYVIGVGHLSDRIKGGEAIQASWPRGDRALTFSERKEMQRRLSAKGFDTKGVDGRIGPLTVVAVRAFQNASGLTPDGYASLNLLEQLR